VFEDDDLPDCGGWDVGAGTGSSGGFGFGGW
jgi:hypothetical protein